MCKIKAYACKATGVSQSCWFGYSNEPWPRHFVFDRVLAAHLPALPCETRFRVLRSSSLFNLCSGEPYLEIGTLTIYCFWVFHSYESSCYWSHKILPSTTSINSFWMFEYTYCITYHPKQAPGIQHAKEQRNISSHSPSAMWWGEAPVSEGRKLDSL